MSTDREISIRLEAKLDATIASIRAFATAVTTAAIQMAGAFDQAARATGAYRILSGLPVQRRHYLRLRRQHIAKARGKNWRTIR